MIAEEKYTHVDVSPASAKWLHLNERGGGWAQPRAGGSYCFFYYYF